MSERPTFYYNRQEIRGSGILFYYLYRGRRFYLFRREHGRWCDIGGKTDQRDKSPLETAVRECCEETNGHMFDERHSKVECYEECMRLIRRDRPVVLYSPRAKYLVHVVRISPELGRNMKRFGRIETHTNQKHFFKFMTVPYRIHPRLWKIKNQL